MLEFAKFAERIGLQRRLLAFIPHPDDETVGCGGLIHLARQADIEVHVIVVTDGAASHPVTDNWPRGRLAATRRAELRAALGTLGCLSEPLFLGLPDAGTEALSAEQEAKATERAAKFAEALSPDVVLTTWRREPHCDHRFAYRLAQGVCGALRLPLVEYMVWAPVIGSATDLPLKRETDVLLLDVSPAARAKDRAIRCHRSQLGKIRSDGFDLTPHLAEMMLPYERYECARSLIASS